LLASAHGLLGQNFIGTLPVPNDDEGRVYFGNIEEDQRILGFDLEIRRDFRRGWMFAATAGVLDAQFLEPPASSDTDGTRVPNAPRGYGSLKAVVPAITNRLYLASRLTLETPRRILLDADTTTDWAVIADMVMTGRIEEYGVKYAFGVYNLFDWTLYLPVDPFVSRTMPQQGRSFMANLSLEY
jgi:outer membrane receptor protein involved in Fe transport